MDKKRVLCFGDSNTFGHDPLTGGRYDDEHRWPSVMQRALGDRYDVISEGLNGRTAVLRFSDEPYLCGPDYFLPCLLSHRPLHRLLIMLGTNDCCGDIDAAGICSGVEYLASIAERLPIWTAAGAPAKSIFIIAPARIRLPKDADSYTRETVEKSTALPGLLGDMAKKHGYGFYDANECTAVGKADLLHLTAEGNIALGWALAELLGAK